MKICTFNVNSMRARKDLVFEWLNHRQGDIDILCFQEIKTVDEGFPVEDFRSMGYESAVFGQKSYNGVAICSRFPLADLARGFGRAEWDTQSRLISAEIEGITLINAYAPHGGLRGTEKYQYKQGWYTAFLDYLRENFSASDPLIVTGDLNVAHADSDVYDATALADTIGTMPEERALLEMLFDWGLIDGFRRMNPEKRMFTWWDYRTAGIWRDEGMRIDYFLCTAALWPRIKEIDIDLWPRRRRVPTPSDHAPLLMVME